MFSLVLGRIKPSHVTIIFHVLDIQNLKGGFMEEQ